MRTFKTGDRVFVKDEFDDDWSTKKLVYLYTREDRRHVCQYEYDWVNGHTSCAPWKFIKQAPKTVKRVKGARELVESLLDAGYTPEMTGWNPPSGKGLKYFDNSMFACCGQEPGLQWIWNPEWLEEVEID